MDQSTAVAPDNERCGGAFWIEPRSRCEVAGRSDIQLIGSTYAGGHFIVVTSNRQSGRDDDAGDDQFFDGRHRQDSRAHHESRERQREAHLPSRVFPVA
jgi:hypothetical protein